MVTKSEDILARKAKYDRIERVTDKTGRVIGVHRLKPSQQLRIQELAPGLDGMTTMTDESTGKTISVPKITPLAIAASVAEIDGSPFPFPRSRGELDMMIDVLDDEGLTAAAAGLANLSSDDSDGADNKESAKNSVETPA